MTQKIVNFNSKLNKEIEIEAEVSSALALADNLSIKSSDSGLSEDTCWAIFGGPCPAALRKGLARPVEDSVILDDDVDETVPDMDTFDMPQEQDGASSAMFEEAELPEDAFLEDVDKQSLIEELYNVQESKTFDSKELLQKSGSGASKGSIVEPSGQGGDSKNDSVSVENDQVQQSVEKFEDITLTQALFDGDVVLKSSLLSTVSTEMVNRNTDFKSVSSILKENAEVVDELIQIKDEAAVEELVKESKVNINGFHKEFSNFKLPKTSNDVNIVEITTTENNIALIEQPIRQDSKVEMLNVVDSQQPKSGESLRDENLIKAEPYREDSEKNEVIEEKHESKGRLAIQSHEVNDNSKGSQTPDINKEVSEHLATQSQEVVLKIENLSTRNSLNALQSPLTSQEVLLSSSASQKSQKISLDRYQQTMIPLVRNISAFTSNISTAQQVRGTPVAISSSADSTPVSKSSVFTPLYTDIESDRSAMSCNCRHCIKSKLKRKTSTLGKCGKSDIQRDNYTIKIFEESQEESEHRNYVKLRSLNEQQQVQKNKRVQTSRVDLREQESLCFSPRVPYHTSPLYINDCKAARSKIQKPKKAASPRPLPMIHCNCPGKCNRDSKWAESSEDSLEPSGKAQRDSLMPSANLLNSLTNAFARREKVREVVNKFEGRNQRCCCLSPNYNKPVKPVARSQFGKEEGCRCCNSRKRSDGAEPLKCQRNCYW